MKFKQKDYLVGLLTYVIYRSQFIRKTLEDFGEAASFNSYLRHRVGTLKIFISREKLYKAVLSKTLKEEELLVLEFGVAAGDGTKWWSENVKNSKMKYIGFDSFDGLPETWYRRGVVYREKGFFAQESAPFFISDERISFCVGLVENNANKIKDYSRTNCNKIYLFDMDLYGPTKFVWDLIRPNLIPGDLVYFDEGFDSDGERLVIENGIFLEFEKWNYIGNSSIAVAFQFKGE